MTAKVNLIIANNATGKIITKNGLSGSNLSEITAPYGKPGGLTFDHNTGQLISSYCPYGMAIGKIIVHVGVTAAISSEFVVPSVNGDPAKVTKPYGLAFDGTNIIAAVYDQDSAPYNSYHIVVFSGKTATVTDRFDIPSTNIRGLSWDGTNLVYSDPTELKIYVLVGKTGVVGSSFNSPYWGADEEPHGLAWDGITLAVIDLYYDRWIRCTYPAGVYIANYASSTYVFGCTVDGRIVASTVTTEDADSVTTSGAKLHGEVIDAGGESVNLLRQFEYKKGLGGAVSTVSGAAGLEGVYDKIISGLDANELYYFRAKSYKYTDPSYGEWLTFFTGPEIVNTSAEYDGVHARVRLYGEIVSGLGMIIVERGFEYLIQDDEPAAEDTGTEVKELGAGFAEEEFYLKNKELYDLQYEDEENIVWWFRTYFRDDGANKYVADSWMKNLPNVITQAMTNINYNKADGNGLIVSEGASELTMRGFTVEHEFHDRLPNSWRFEIGGFEGEPEAVVVHDSFGVLVIDMYWEGTLTKTVFETFALALGAYSMTIGEMLFGWPIMQDCLVEGKDYTCRAFAENEFGRVYGDPVDFSTWARTYFSPLDVDCIEIVGETTVIENAKIENLPVGITATRRGFRYGTTEAADEFDAHEDGSFTNGAYSMVFTDLLPNTTYYVVAYIVVNGIVYEGNVKTKTTDAEGTEDSDEYPTPHFSPHGQDYREIETKVFAEVAASQGIIDFSGGKKTLPIVNHLIQTNPDAKTIADDYLARFKLAKTRMNVSYPTPLPFEREDTIDFSFGKVKFKENDLGVITFKEDGLGVLGFADQITMIIKQINSVGLTKTPESIEYVADLDLEHE